MSESKTESAQVAAPSPRRARRIKGIVLATAVALTAGVGAAAWADGRGGGCGWYGGPDMMGGPGGPGMMGGPGGHGMMWGGGRGGDRMFEGLNLTDAQRTQIRQIRQAAAADMRSQFDAARALHEKSVAIFTAPMVDAAAAESLRQQMLAQRDATSKRMTQAMVDVANVLTPEQRATLAERIKARGERWRQHMQYRQGASAPKN